VAALYNAGGIDLYLSTDQGATWTLAETVAGLAYPALAASTGDSRFWLVGYSFISVGGATGSAVCHGFRAEGSSLVSLGSATVGASDLGRSAILAKSTDWSLRVVTPKTTEWTAPNWTPGRAEYLSLDAGRTWALQSVHGET
jgi:hypothetical protein